jgi:adenine-specific DNA methylase
MISSIKELEKINFEEIEEDEFWNQSEQKELYIHKVHVYPAKFLSLIAQKDIKYCDKNDFKVETVADIFCGCGTVAVEAKRLGYNFYGCDLNPVAVMIARVKSSSYEIEKIEKYYKEIVSKYNSYFI